MVRPSPLRRPLSLLRCRRLLRGSFNSRSAHWRSHETLSDLKVAIFADGAEKSGMLEMYAKPYIKGFTTNPTLMRKAGITDYEKFARDILGEIPDRPISFEVFADEFPEMARQARKIATWGKNIRVKDPGNQHAPRKCDTAVRAVGAGGHSAQRNGYFHAGPGAGRGRCGARWRTDLCIYICGSYCRHRGRPCTADRRGGASPCGGTHYQLIWASPRELLNIFQAEHPAVGCHIITVTNDILQKLFGRRQEFLTTTRWTQ